MPVITSHAISKESSRENGQAIGQATGVMQQRLFRISSMLLIFYCVSSAVVALLQALKMPRPLNRQFNRREGFTGVHPCLNKPTRYPFRH
jgi:hypothetical protein